MHPNTEKALVVLSGGQDSTTCLYWAIRKFGKDNVTAVTFDYGQRHHIELACAEIIAAMAGVQQTVLPIDTFAAIGGNALTDASITPQTETSESGAALPNTFVPGRNLIFLTFAAALAYTKGIQHLVTGVAQTDYSGYPDCRENTLKALELALRLGMKLPILRFAFPMLAFAAILHSYFSVFLGARSGLVNMLGRLRRRNQVAAPTDTPHPIEWVTTLLIALPLWLLAIADPSILAIIGMLAAPIIALVCYVMPVYLFHRIPQLSVYRDRTSALVLVSGLLVITSYTLGYYL